MNPREIRVSKAGIRDHTAASLRTTLARSIRDLELPVRAEEDPPLPSPALLAQLIDVLTSWIFPGLLEEQDDGSIEDCLVELLEAQFAAGLHTICPRATNGSCDSCKGSSISLTQEFLATLYEVQRRLLLDLEAAFEGDPAAKSREEILLCYPGFLAVVHYRLAHEIDLLGIPLIPRIITERAHAATGIDIHPAAAIGDGLFLDHGTGIVIGETCQIGNGVRIYQGVTLGAKKLSFDDHGKAVRGISRHPIVEENVVIYAGATILGRVRIGRESVIGGNVWLTRSVPPRSRITQATLRHNRFEEGAGI